MVRLLFLIFLIFLATSALTGEVLPKPQEIQTAEFRGRLYLLGGKPKPTAIVLIGGSEGQLDLAQEIAPQLAAAGYAVLGVDYHDGYRPGRKLDLVPIETFTHAVSWLRGSSVHPAAVAVLGDSRGSEAALLTGAFDSTVDAVVAFVPSSVLWGATDNDAARHHAAWSWHGAPLGCANCTGSDDFSATLDKLPANDAARIPVERIHGAVFLAGSEEDAVWPSARMAREIASRLKTANFAYPVTLLTFPHGSHQMLGTGPSNAAATYEYGGKTYTMNYGGTAAGTEEARNQSWVAMLRFLDAIPQSRGKD